MVGGSNLRGAGLRLAPRFFIDNPQLRKVVTVANFVAVSSVSPVQSVFIYPSARSQAVRTARVSHFEAPKHKMLCVGLPFLALFQVLHNTFVFGFPRSVFDGVRIGSFGRESQ